MVDDATGSFSDIVNQEDYEFLRSNMQFMTSDEPGTSDLNPMLFNIINEEVTLDMADYKYIDQVDYLDPVFPPNDPQQLCNTDYSGPFNFEVFVDPNGLKNPWEYSPALNKVYIDIKTKFPINFSVKSPTETSLFVRVMPMFEEDRYVQEIVQRCICHQQPQDATNYGVPDHVVQHIIRCDNNRARYCGDAKGGKRLSTVIPLSNPQAGTDSVKEFFTFVCKNSCVGGMNRRPIQVVFTLENQIGTVLGRRVLCVRVCSCPKRDREKEEKKNQKQEVPVGKKRKLEKKEKVASASESTDSRVFNLNLNITGERAFKAACDSIYRVLASECFKLEGKGDAADAAHRRAINELQAQQKKYFD